MCYPIKWRKVKKFIRNLARQLKHQHAEAHSLFCLETEKTNVCYLKYGELANNNNNNTNKNELK